VKRGTTSNGPYPQIFTSTTTSYNDASVANGTTYYYVVSAVNAAGEGALSSQVSATPVPPAPAKPTNLSATAGDATVTLNWTASSGATNYKVKRSTTNGGPYSQYATPTTASYTDTSVTNGLTYYYVVSAVNAGGESANSTQVTASPVALAANSIVGLHVSGNKILNGANQQVTLRGVNKQGTEYQCLYSAAIFDGPSDANSVTVLKTWSINIVRLPINEQCWLGINGVPVGGTTASDYRAAIVNYVNLLNAGNIAVIIDLQWAAPGTYLANKLTPMPDADHAPAFWTSVANTFKSNSSVIFDLFNEPWPDNNGNSTAAWTCLREGGNCTGVTYDTGSTQVPYTAVGTQSLVNTIRATGSTNIIMVPGLQFTNVLDQWLTYKPNDPAGQLAASWHSYAGQICSTLSCWTGVIQPVLANVPLITGEIGENDCATTYINPLMTFLDSVGANYLAWAWNAYSDPAACNNIPALISDYNGTPTAFGIGFRDHLIGH